MIPVTLQPEPQDFDAKVRRKGRAWLEQQGIALDSPPPDPSALPRYWSASNQQLWCAYSGICAYLAIFFEWDEGAASTDHFVAKSKNAGDTYEWSNYRLSCLGPNRNKGDFNDVLDPVNLTKHTFVINFASGKISPSPTLPPAQKAAATDTIRRLKLDSPTSDRRRARHYEDYARGRCSLDYIQRYSPFIYQEIVRQGLEQKGDGHGRA